MENTFSFCISAYSCDSNLRFDYAMQACNHTCRSLSSLDPTCDMPDDPVEGCGCPSGTHLNTPLMCSPRALCHCHYPGGTTPPGPVVIDGRQWYAVLIFCHSNTCLTLIKELSRKCLKDFSSRKYLDSLLLFQQFKSQPNAPS